jgi:3-hydroxyisobutyrate dehydrogenase-like beta-hydroxyacid dehydrogenase
VVEASTFTLDDKQRAERPLLKAGHVMLDCPVSGTGAQAAVKDIVVYASGDAKAIAKATRMFSDFSRAAYNVGEFGNGSRMKYVANLLVTIHNVASAEAGWCWALNRLIPDGLRPHPRGRRHLAGVRGARPDDGEEPL